MRSAVSLALLSLGLAATGCRSGWVESRAGPSFQPDRQQYVEFREQRPEVLEPNYLPFMAHRVPGAAAGQDALLFCRWPEDRFPLPVYVEPPQIAPTLQDEFAPRPANAYVAAIYEALATWERELEGLVRFRPVTRPEDAVLALRLIGEVAPAPDDSVTVLGTTRLGGACRVRVAEEIAERAEVDFEVSEVRIFVADGSGLLNPDQVERIALHEIGHALGMRGHSPLPGDLMFEVARDRPIRESTLSSHDVNSFVSLYRIPNGTVFARVEPGAPSVRAARPPPAGRPRLDAAPHVDARYGYELRPPEGWARVESSHGMIAVDGVSWDYDASFQVLVRRYPTIESYIERHGPAHLGDGWLRESERREVAGRPALWAVVEGRIPGMIEEITFIERGDGHVVIVIADCTKESHEAYRPWFEAALGSLELWEGEGETSGP